MMLTNGEVIIIKLAQQCSKFIYQFVHSKTVAWCIFVFLVMCIVMLYTENSMLLKRNKELQKQVPDDSIKEKIRLLSDEVGVLKKSHEDLRGIVLGDENGD